MERTYLFSFWLNESYFTEFYGNDAQSVATAIRSKHDSFRDFVESNDLEAITIKVTDLDGNSVEVEW